MDLAARAVSQIRSVALRRWCVEVAEIGAFGYRAGTGWRCVARRWEGGGVAIGPDFTFEQLHHVQLAIPFGGEDECRRFWVGVLGMTELEKPEALAARGGCWFRGGGVEVHLGVEREFVPAGKAHPGIVVTELRALADRLVGGGTPVTWDDNFPGFDRFHASDPFGNRLEFLQPK